MFEERIAEMNRETETMQAHYAPEKRTYTVDEIQDILPASTLGWTIRVNLSRMSRD